jgi:PAS domain S-box-containing protein
MIGGAGSRVGTVRTMTTGKRPTVEQTLLDLSSDAFVLLDERGMVRSLNAAAERLFGYTALEAKGRVVTTLCPGLEGSGSIPSPRRLTARRRDGSELLVDLQLARVGEDDGGAAVLVAKQVGDTDPTGNLREANAARLGGFGYWDRDLLTGTVTCSPDTLRILGLSKDEPSTDPQWFVRLIHPEDRSEFERALESSLSRFERLDVTHRIVRPDGAVRTMRSIAEYRFDANGVPLALLGVVQDVTDLARADEALRDTQQTLKAVIDGTTAVIYIKSLDGRYSLVNRRFEELFHVTNETARGRPDHELFPRAVADAFRANDVRVLQAGRALEFEEIAPHDDGPHTYISIKFPLQRATGEIYAVCGISTDITARKRAEEELDATRRSLERLVDDRTADLRDSNVKLQAEVVEREDAVGQLQRLIETANEGIWIIDAARRTTFANARMAEILGTTSEAMQGRSVFEFMDEEGARQAEESLGRRWRGISEQLDFEYQRKDGSRVWTHLASSPVTDRHGAVIGALAMVTDISERKRAEHYQHLLLQELDHRVKNTLATVVALVDLTMGRARSLEEFASSFAGRVQSMARTHEALARARWQDLSFDEVVAIVLAPLESGEAARIVARGEAVQVTARTITPLALALNELATNALKHGGLASSGGRVRIDWEVAEDGAFALRWEEEGGAIVYGTEGKGSGLRLIRGLIEHELDGKLDVSLPPEGLRCRITLPATTTRLRHGDEVAGASASAPRGRSPEPERSESLAADSLNGLRVIIVEDNFAVASSLGWLLESYGCRVVGTAGSVAAGCKLVDEADFDVGVLDISLGDSDVAPVARRIQARAKRIVYLTGYAGMDRLPPDLRAHPCLPKPVQAEQLVSAMRGG